MALFLTVVVLGIAVLTMPEVFSELAQSAIDNPAYGLGLLALLVLVGVWIDRQ